ncbi:DUF2723 domain-containing protein [Patescibacteria group bacterium]|nr:DUF2723 domain-containing protein [Patescibacteria group bacterium]
MKRKNLLVATILFLLTLLVYLHNLSPSVHGADSGDFITAAISKGVPHPSGYPLHTALGVLFASLPIPFTYASRVGLTSVLFSSLTIAAFYLLINELTKKRYLAIITSLTLAFTYPFWLYAEIVEVFALQSFLMVLLLFLTVKYINTKKIRYFYYLCLTVGLSLTNNLIILLLFPPIFLTLLVADRQLILKPILAPRILVKGIFLFFIGLIPYIYIPIAARSFPSVNWGVAVTLKNFWYLISRRDYGWGVANIDTEILRKSFVAYFDYWSIYVPVLVLLLIVLGLIYLVSKKRFSFLVLVLTSYIFFGPFFVFYGRTPFTSLLKIAVHEKFYTASAVILLILFPFGILLITETINKLLKNKNLSLLVQKIILVTFFIIPISLFINNFKRTDLSNVFIGDNYALDILTSLPENSVLLLQGDTNGFNTTYMQIAYNVRPDVYIPGRQEGFIDILKEAGFTDEEIQAYTIEKRSGIDREIVASTIGPMLTKRPIFSDTKREMIDNEYGKIVSIPYGLLYKLEFEDNLPYTKERYLSEITKVVSLYHINELKRHGDVLSYNLILADIKKWYSIAYFRIGEYLVEEYDDLEGAAEFVQLSGELDPLI